MPVFKVQARRLAGPNRGKLEMFTVKAPNEAAVRHAFAEQTRGTPWLSQYKIVK